MSPRAQQAGGLRGPWVQGGPRITGAGQCSGVLGQSLDRDTTLWASLLKPQGSVILPSLGGLLLKMGGHPP